MGASWRVPSLTNPTKYLKIGRCEGEIYGKGALGRGVGGWIWLYREASLRLYVK